MPEPTLGTAESVNGENENVDIAIRTEARRPLALTLAAIHSLILVEVSTRANRSLSEAPSIGHTKLRLHDGRST